jgi:hypothetical protein
VELVRGLSAYGNLLRARGGRAAARRAVSQFAEAREIVTALDLQQLQRTLDGLG